MPLRNLNQIHVWNRFALSWRREGTWFAGERHSAWSLRTDRITVMPSDSNCLIKGFPTRQSRLKTEVRASRNRVSGLNMSDTYTPPGSAFTTDAGAYAKVFSLFSSYGRPKASEGPEEACGKFWMPVVTKLFLRRTGNNRLTYNKLNPIIQKVKIFQSVLRGAIN